MCKKPKRLAWRSLTTWTSSCSIWIWMSYNLMLKNFTNRLRSLALMLVISASMVLTNAQEANALVKFKWEKSISFWINKYSPKEWQLLEPSWWPKRSATLCIKNMLHQSLNTSGTSFHWTIYWVHGLLNHWTALCSHSAGASTSPSWSSLSILGIKCGRSSCAYLYAGLVI